MEGEVERMDGAVELELMINSIEGNIPTQGLYFFKLTQKLNSKQNLKQKSPPPTHSTLEINGFFLAYERGRV